MSSSDLDFLNYVLAQKDLPTVFSNSYEGRMTYPPAAKHSSLIESALSRPKTTNRLCPSPTLTECAPASPSLVPGESLYFSAQVTEASPESKVEEAAR